MHFTIRQYRHTDLAAVLNSWEMATRSVHPLMTDKLIAQERENVSPNTDTWVVDFEDDMKGFISLIGNEVRAISYYQNITT